MARSSYKVTNIKLTDKNFKGCHFDRYEVTVNWTDKTGELHVVTDVVNVSLSTVYGKSSKPLHIQYPSNHLFFVNGVNFKTLGENVDRGIITNVSKTILKFIYPIEGRQYIAEIF